MFINCPKNLSQKDLPGEIWYNIGVVDGVNYTGYYEVSNFLRTRNVSRYITYKNGKVCFLKSRIKKPTIGKNGYYTISLRKDGISKNTYLHRIIAATFIYNDDPNHKTYINHKDEDKLNNLPSNLEWCTPKYNVIYGTAPEKRSKTMKKKYANGEIISNPPHIKKTVIQTDLEGNYIKTWEGAIDTEQDGYNSDTVNACCRGRVLTHKNCFWMYEKDFTQENIKCKIEKLQSIKNVPKAVVQLELDGTFIKTWDKASSAKSFGFNNTCIRQCCIGKKKTHHGYKWMYLSDYEKLNN